MLNQEVREILLKSKKGGWVMEPEAKRLLSLAGLDVPMFKLAKAERDLLGVAQKIGYPLVAKVVSPDLVHKSDLQGVALGIEDEQQLKETFLRFSKFKGFAGVLVEEMVSGVELIVGAKVDYQFGPVILLGIGGTGVEIYKDTALRMAPLKASDVDSMIRDLKAHELLEGYRGSDPIDLYKLKNLLVSFSELAMELEDAVDSVDLNPVMCSSDRCVVADARIMLKTDG